jgi:hypothetical protein
VQGVPSCFFSGFGQLLVRGLHLNASWHSPTPLEQSLPPHRSAGKAGGQHSTCHGAVCCCVVCNMTTVMHDV